MPGQHRGGKKPQIIKTQTLKSAQPLAREAREGPEEGREGEGEGSSAESPGAVGGSHTCGARQQTQFTKRHLFHYSNALWLITSWPVCEMTATYSPVNRKICTCSIWGVRAASGGSSGRQGEQTGGKRKEEETQEIRFSGKTIPVERRRGETRVFRRPRFKREEFVFAAVAFPSYSRTAGPRAGRESPPSPLPRVAAWGQTHLPFCLCPQGQTQETQLVGSRVRLLMGSGWGSF